MVLNNIEIIALVFAFFVLIKVLVLTISKKTWIRFVKKVYSRPFIISSVFFVIALVVLYYLLQTLTIVEVFASVAFAVLLLGSSLALFSKEIINLASKVKSHRMNGIEFLQIIIWALLAIWVLSELIL